MKEFFAGLRRLFAPRPEPPAEPIGEPTADRPPPPVAERVESPPATEPPPEIEPPPAMESLPVMPAPPREPPIDVDELAEVKAALEAVAEMPAPASPIPPSASVPEAVDVPGPVVEPPSPPVAGAEAQVGDALVLTLATPPVTFTVAKTGATLGRGQENTIRLDDLSVSRRHARIAYRQGAYWLSDLGSMGGTWVEGARLSAPRRLAAGEVIDIGLCRLTVGSAGTADETKKSETKGSTSKSRSEVAGQVRRRR
jgi:pSer/pThr/pTyr-binding forkhead associated (FHA) protein